MNTSGIGPNLVPEKQTGCKDILMKKLSCAVFACILSQLMLLLLFLLAVNISLFNIADWMSSLAAKLTSVTTWLCLIPFYTIIFAQSLICAKEYVLLTKYSSSRFWKFVSVFSIHNFIQLSLHIISGGLVTWLYLALAGGKYATLAIEEENKTFLVPEKLFLILCGLWSGFYYFVNIYLPEKKLLFPLLYQYKILQFKSKFFSVINKCKTEALTPTIYFSIFYYIFGSYIEEYFCDIFEITVHTKSGLLIYIYAWVFTTIYYVKMQLMRFFFEMFLTEPINFRISMMCKDDLILGNAISMANVPVIQHLACYDLYMLSFWDVSKRAELFTLSQPGGHPHNWNNLIQNVLKVIEDFSQTINKSTSSILEPEKNKWAKTEIQTLQNTQIAKSLKPCSELINNQVLSPEKKFRNIRNMSMIEEDCLNVVDVKYPATNAMLASANSLKSKTIEKFNSYLQILKLRLGITFLFGELPEINLQSCLANSQVIILIVEGLSTLISKALKEDTYGVVQKDLAVILTSFVDLKINIEKLNRIPALNRKSSDFYSKIKISLNAAVKRAIFHICIDYGPYLKDLNLKKEILQYLQSVVAYRNHG